MMLLDGEPVNACSYLALQAAGRAVTTVEGLAGDAGLDPLQVAFLDRGGVQCGFCTPGHADLGARRCWTGRTRPTEEEVRVALAGNLCRCTGYDGIVKAVLGRRSRATRVAMIVDCAHYLEGVRQHEGPMDLARAAEIVPRGRRLRLARDRRAGPRTSSPRCRTRFGLHDLAVEDAQSFHLRPKIEKYDEGGVYFAVLRTARYVHEREEVEFGEVCVFMSDRFVITVRQGVASDLHGARLRLERRPELLREGTASVLWAILDQIVDDYAPVAGGAGARRRGGRAHRVQRRRRGDRADLLPAPRGDRLLPRRAPAARPARRRSSAARTCPQPAARAVLPRRQRPPEARQRGGRRPARPARDRARRRTWR